MSKAVKFGIAIAALLALGAIGVWCLTPRPRPVPAAVSSPLATPEPAAVGAAPSIAAAQPSPQALPTATTLAAQKALDAQTPMTGTEAPPAAMLPSDSPLPSGPFTSEQFRELTAKTLRELPTPAQMRDITDAEAHGYPPALAKAGPMLGVIAQAAQDQPELAGAAADFYIRCVQGAEVLMPVRALCYSHVLKDPKAPPAQSLPPEVVRLAHLIPEDGARKGQ